MAVLFHEAVCLVQQICRFDRERGSNLGYGREGGRGFTSLDTAQMRVSDATHAREGPLLNAYVEAVSIHDLTEGDLESLSVY